MNSFSQRNRFTTIKNILQIDNMDEDLRNSLWNVLQIYYWGKAEQVLSLYADVDKSTMVSYENLFKIVWIDYFKKPLDTISLEFFNIMPFIKRYFFDCKWYEVYDFMEFFANKNFLDLNKEFMDSCNIMLERELSAYRFIDNLITPIISETEIAEIEEVLKNSEPYKTVNTHLHRALKLLSDRQSPDYRNSIKESISAVESIAKIITEDDKATLGDALKKIDKKIKIHKALIESFLKIYGYTNDADGIRHSLMEDSNLDFEDAKFMLVSCSAFANYLIVKIEKAKIQDIPND